MCFSSFSNCAFSRRPKKISCLMGPMMSTRCSRIRLRNSRTTKDSTLLRRRRASDRTLVSTSTLTNAFRAYVSGLNAADRVKHCPVASILLKRDRAKVATRFFSTFQAIRYQFPW